ncbi:transglycosylase [Staphylococcus arlettae]|uniref:aggregation-promoting factor C-terminal-like domain-containing protein n=1 Tax=Staphylococcus arlettae TaxID=29378 RepID=UPI003B9F941D
MKKTVLASSLAVALGVTGYAANSNQADASEQNIDKAHLAELALSNAQELNEKPVHSGSYDYDFNYNGHSFKFESNGTTWTWSYDGGSSAQTSTDVQAPQAQASSQSNASVEAPKAVEAPKTETTKEVQTEQTSASTSVKTESAPAQTTTKTSTSASTSSSSASTGGSTKAQFLAAGGTEAMWNTIVMPESSGNPNAVNELGYRGLGQTKESWGTGSVAEQTKGMINYANERYGSVEAALDFRSSNNWW